jgi:hypothetical protein
MVLGFQQGYALSRILLRFIRLLRLKRCMRVTNSMPLGRPLPLAVGTVNYATTLKVAPPPDGIGPITSSI